MGSTPRHVIIVGGGISGLAAAYTLQSASGGENRPADIPVTCTLIERERRPGGKILTEEVQGFLIEGGPDSFLSQKPWAVDLCRRLGLGDRLVCTNREQKNIYVFSRGRLHQVPEGLVLMVPTRLISFLRSPLMSVTGKLRMACDLVIPPRRDSEDESLASFVRRRLGQEVLDTIVEPLMAGIYAGSPEDMSLKSTFPRFSELEQECGSLIKGLLAKRHAVRPHQETPPLTMFLTLRRGISELVEALVSTLNRTTFMMGQEVRAIRSGQSGSSRYTVDCTDGASYHADAVVLATPSHITAALIAGLDQALAKTLLEIPHTSTATVSLGYTRQNVPHPLNGFGFVVPRREHRRIMACTWTSTKFPHRAPADYVLLRCFVGGVGREELVQQDDTALVTMVREDLRDIMGITETPVLTKVYRWIRANPQYVVGHEARLATIEAALTRHPGIFLTGSAYYGVGIPDCIHHGTETALRVLQHLQKGR